MKPSRTIGLNSVAILAAIAVATGGLYEFHPQQTTQQPSAKPHFSQKTQTKGTQASATSPESSRTNSSTELSKTTLATSPTANTTTLYSPSSTIPSNKGTLNSTNSSGSSSIVLGSGNIVYDATGMTHYATRLQGMVAIAQGLGLTPDPSGQSSYDDVPTSSAAWGLVHAMLKKGLVPGLTPTHFGANNVISLATISQTYRSTRGSFPLNEYEPGNGDDITWGQAIELLSNITGGAPFASNVQENSVFGLCLRQSELIILTANLRALTQGYTVGPSGYKRLIYPVAYEYMSTFSGSIYSVQPLGGVQAAIDTTYRTMNNIWEKSDGNAVIVSIPSFAMSSGWRIVAGNTIDFSLDNGVSWQTSHSTGSSRYSFYDSQSAASGGVSSTNLPARILLRAGGSQSLSVRLYDGRNLMAVVQIGWANGLPTYTRSNAVDEQGA